MTLLITTHEPPINSPTNAWVPLKGSTQTTLTGLGGFRA